MPTSCNFLNGNEYSIAQDSLLQPQWDANRLSVSFLTDSANDFGIVKMSLPSDLVTFVAIILLDLLILLG
jgi:hypothetical protein